MIFHFFLRVLVSGESRLTFRDGRKREAAPLNRLMAIYKESKAFLEANCVRLWSRRTTLWQLISTYKKADLTVIIFTVAAELMKLKYLLTDSKAHTDALTLTLTGIITS